MQQISALAILFEKNAGGAPRLIKSLMKSAPSVFNVSARGVKDIRSAAPAVAKVLPSVSKPAAQAGGRYAQGVAGSNMMGQLRAQLGIGANDPINLRNYVSWAKQNPEAARYFTLTKNKVNGRLGVRGLAEGQVAKRISPKQLYNMGYKGALSPMERGTYETGKFVKSHPGTMAAGFGGLGAAGAAGGFYGMGGMDSQQQGQPVPNVAAQPQVGPGMRSNAMGSLLAQQGV